MSRYNFKTFLSRFIDDPDDCDLFKYLAHLPVIAPGGPWVAGGAVRRTLQKTDLSSDIDFFFKDETQLAAFDESIIDLGAIMSSDNDHARTYRLTVAGDDLVVQAITMSYYETLEACLDSFDFTITQCGYDGTDLVVGEFTLWDLARKRLALHKLTYGVSTMRRIIKYTRQGFTACGGALASILEQTIADPQTVHREVEYVD